MEQLLTILGLTGATLSVAIVATVVVRSLARRYGIVDHPTGGRKHHQKPTPLLGGVAVIMACAIGVGLSWSALVGGYLLPKHLIGFLLGGLVLLVGGVLDDRLNLPPHRQIVFPLCAAIIICVSGIGIDYITNPFGGVWQLDGWQMEIFRLGGVPYHFTVWADVFTVVWLLGMMYTTKFLDGLDGLVSGVTTIGALIIAVLSLSAAVFQPETALLALIVAAAFLGCLIFNWHPASIFLGESGSLFAGFALGLLAIISGGKIATALLILGIPILDVAWVIFRRVRYRQSPFAADRRHLHLRLVDSGLSTRTVVLLLYALTVAFGLSSLVLQSRFKVVALVTLGVTMLVVGGVLVKSMRQPRT